MDKKDIIQLPTASLAYLGDAVLEILVRERLILDGNGDIHKRALSYVTAVAQSKAAEKLLSLLTEDEADVYKRGRNNTHTAPKSATHAEYSRATGLECLFAYLYLAKNEGRIKELFEIGFKAD